MKISSNPYVVLGLFFIALLALNLAGCATKPRPPFERISPEKGMIYGNIRIPGHEVTEIEMRQYGKFYIPPFISPPRVMIYRNGNFVVENLDPGNYYISRFIAKKLIFPLVKDSQSAYQKVFNVQPGELKYLGSFIVTNVKPGFYTQGDFHIRLARHPSERRVLKHMFDVTEGTGWQALIDRRIRSLR